MGTLKGTKAKLLVVLIIFMIVFSNCGFTLSAIATSNEFQVITNGFFKKDEIDFKAYFEDEKGNQTTEITGNVNQKVRLILEILPQVDGYLKSANLKAVSENDSDVNFKITGVSYYEEEDSEDSSLEAKQNVNLNLKENEEENEEKPQEPENTVVENTVQETNSSVENIAENNNIANEVSNSVENTAIENTSAEPQTEDDGLSGSAMVSTNSVSEISNTTNENVANEFSNSAVNEVSNSVTNEVSNEVSNTLVNTVANEVSNSISNETENEVANNNENNTEEVNNSETTENVGEPSNEIVNEEDILIDEEKVIEEKFNEEKSEQTIAEQNLLFDMKTISDTEIELRNVIKETKFVLDLEYKMGDTLKVEDLMKDIYLQLSGTYINSDLEEVPVAKEEKVTLGWEYSKDVTLTSEFTKFSPFEVGDIKGTIVENKISVKRDITDDKYLPVKNTKLEVGVPSVNGKNPIEINVIGEKLLATRGEDIGYTNFGKDNWTYDAGTGKIQISVENTNLVYTSGVDEYVIIYRYEDMIEAENSDLGKDVKLTVEEFSGKDNHIIKKEINEMQNIKVDVGELITYSISSTEEKINKAKIYANYNNETPIYETEYSNQINVNILTSDILEELKINCDKEVYKDANGLEFEAQGIEYKRIKFSYSEISNLLVNGGEIVIENTSGEVLYVLNKDIIKSEEDCAINLDGQSGIIIYARNIAKNGNLNFEVVKAIKACNYDKSAFKNFTSIESRITAEVKYEKIEERLALSTIGTAKAFEESKTLARLSLNKETLSTTKSNENVEIKIELNNDKEDSDLYINPAFEVVFPKYVNDVTIQNLNVLYENGLRVKTVDTYKENDITKIKVELEGIQKTFSESSITNGTNIIINANIKVDEYTPKKEDQIKLYYFNEGVSTYESQTKWSISKPIPSGVLKTTNGFDVSIIKYQAPDGLIAINGITNYDGNLSELKSVKQGEIKQEIETNGSSKIMTMELLALNNTDNKCTDIVLLGRIPFAGVKDVVTNKDLGTTVNTVMKDMIKEDIQNTNTVDIYYSTNPEATKDLDNIGNGWFKEVANLNEIKSFLIVVKGAMEAGQVLRYTYDFEVPANLPYETNIEGSFGAFYNNNSEIAVTYESSVADPVGLATETGPKVEAVLSADVGDGTDVKECNFITYTLTVKNIGSVVAEGITVKAPAPEHTEIYDYRNATDKLGDYVHALETSVEFYKDILNPNEVFEVQYIVRANELDTLEYLYKTMGNEILTDEDGTYYITKEIDGTEKKNYFNPNEKVEQTIKNKITVSFSNLESDIESNTITNKIIKANYKLEASILEKFDTYIVGNSFTISGLIKNISENDIEDGTIQLVLPKEIKYNEANNLELDIENYTTNFDEKSNIITINFKKLEKGKSVLINFGVISNAFADRAEVKLIGKTKDEKDEVTNVFVRLRGPKLHASQVSNVVNNKVLEQNEVKFMITISNLGTVSVEDIMIENNIPENLEDIKVTSPNSVDKLNIDSEKIEIYVRSLGQKETKTFVISGRAAKLNGESYKIIASKAKVSQQYADDIYTDEIKVSIEKNNMLSDGNNSGYNTNNDDNNDDNSDDNNSNNESNKTGYNTNVNSQFDDKNSFENSSSNNGNENDTSNTYKNNSNNTSNGKPQYTVSGQVWLDINSNGTKDEDERIPAVKVQLMKGNSNIQVTTTDSFGDYKFTNVEQGEYSIIFTFDKEKYKATLYNYSNEDGAMNSDAQQNSEGIAVTNIINVVGNVANVDLGLVKKDNFDLTVSKYITKSVITTPDNKREEFKYEDLDLAKIEIAAKKLNKSKVDITYKIIIENVGNISGKAATIIDYLPEEMNFEENLNSGWYLGNDGNAYNETLKDIELKPGEKRELTITLRKTMTEENTGVSSNMIEVRTENQESNRENNVNTQETLILIKTGSQTVYVTITILILLVATVVYVHINKNQVYLNKDNKKQIKIKKIYK